MWFKKRPLFNQPLKILLLTNSIILLAGAMFAPIYALFVSEIGGDLLDASYAGGIFALAAGITTLLSGKYSDRVKENELIVVAGYLIMGVGFLLLSICNSVWFLLVIQVLIGLGEAIYSPAFDAVYSKHLDKKQAGKQWGAWESINYFSLAVGAIVGGVIVTTTNFQVLFIIMAMMSFFSAIYIYRLPREVL
ncbi:MAG: MFS transporter [Patescibacteria group bacterium]|jgi:MFS family permease|nr:MFS transporter [Patescibacteria group bacterium]